MRRPGGICLCARDPRHGRQRDSAHGQLQEPAAYASRMVLPPSMQGLLPAGWLAFTGRESNSLDRYKRFQIILLLFWTWPGAREVSFLNLPLASHHSITTSAATSSLSGTVRPSALAVLRLMTSSNLVGWTTGRSAAFSPLRMR